MTSSDQNTWGIILAVGGNLLIVCGFLLSLTGIGACLGIPMALAAIPIVIWGAVWIYQARNRGQQEAIAAGINQALEHDRTERQRAAADLRQNSGGVVRHDGDEPGDQKTD